MKKIHMDNKTEEITGKRQREDEEPAGKADNPMEDISFVGLSDMCAPEVNDILQYHNGYEFFDETSGEALDPVLVARACQDELNRFEAMKVYSYFNRSELPEGSKIIGVKWVHVNTGNANDQVVRCRLVCQEFNDGTSKDELFAGTPPLYVMKLILSVFASEANQLNKKIMIMDAKSAFLYGSVKRDIYIELPSEGLHSRSGRIVGKLNKAMYGTRDAPQIWQEVVEAKMTGLGFRASILHPSIY